MSRIKNSQVQNLEDEYIKALQEEVKILEYETKILKDKEMEQQASASQIDKFFSDGIPLNDNILSLKTQYQNQKSEGEKLLDTLDNQKKNEANYNQTQLNNMKNHKNNLANVERDHLTKDEELKQAIKQLRIDNYDERHLKMDLEKKMRKLQADFKIYTDENLKMNRMLDKDRIQSSHKEEAIQNFKLKLKRDVDDRDIMITELQDDLDKLQSEQSLNPQVKQIEQENLELGGKLLKCEKEIGMASAKIKESEMLLEIRAQDREQESEQKRDLVNKILMIKLQIDEANKMNELVIQQKVKEKEDADIRYFFIDINYKGL